MSKIIVGDCECNGLNPDRIHCIVLQELGTDTPYVITDNFRDEYLKCIREGYTYVFHNSIGYDYVVLKDLLGIDYSVAPDTINGIPVQIIDTLVLSRELNPDRLGGHSLKAWEERVTGHKPGVDDWEDQPLEVYVERCKADVELTGNVFIELMKEAGIEI